MGKGLVLGLGGFRSFWLRGVLESLKCTSHSLILKPPKTPVCIGSRTQIPAPCQKQSQKPLKNLNKACETEIKGNYRRGV